MQQITRRRLPRHTRRILLQQLLMEKTMMSGEPINLPNGEQRMWLEDGDELILRGRAHREGFVSIGFGVCTGRIIPALTIAA